MARRGDTVLLATKENQVKPRTALLFALTVILLALMAGVVAGEYLNDCCRPR